ncbi:acyl carrier protein [Streptomyces sp. 3MP-14]|uniref:Acyl carrier protein n=1 Tax=Streptomyces mimosae TaxID=2586635 RepID=A0A5N5ZW49_9ACTN|nr:MULTISPECIES: acyl carrier protein [Streptomyces]KAB8159580.1 acyl carrier protein [Streptomyces mimosae]KAB8172858.1 acyl carrier protein [Streptomyces sp. 3MP-14]
MNDIDDFVTLIRAEMGLPVTRENVGVTFDELPQWDSVHLLTLLSLLERETSRSIAVPDALEATSLADLYELAVAPAAP